MCLSPCAQKALPLARKRRCHRDGLGGNVRGSCGCIGRRHARPGAGLPTNNGNLSKTASGHQPRPAAPAAIPGRWSRVSSGFYAPAPLGGTSRKSKGRGAPCGSGSTVGTATERWTRSSAPCRRPIWTSVLQRLWGRVPRPSLPRDRTSQWLGLWPWQGTSDTGPTGTTGISWIWGFARGPKVLTAGRPGAHLTA